MAEKLMKIRRADTCATCACDLPATTKAWWDSTLKTVTCVACQPALVSASVPPAATNLDAAQPAPSKTSASPEPATRLPEQAQTLPDRRAIETGDAGASAQREYERRSAKHTKKIEDRWGTGKIGSIAKFVIDEPQHTTAWAKGADGERRLANHLKRELSNTSVVLNDRKVKGTRGNIDHIAVTSGGVWIIDAKNYKGMVERRDVGGMFKSDVRLFVNGRDRSKAVKGMEWQHRVVTEELISLGRPEVPVYQALCFTNAEWPLLKKQGKVGGVWIVSAQKLVKIANEKIQLDEGDIANLAMHLSMIFPTT